jgi:hypothetical protein
MFFIFLMILTTLSLAASAAFFSVYGLMQTYPGIAFAILAMGASLEMGKLMLASVLYRMWPKLGLSKIFLSAAVAVLMIVTSCGIFGYLTGSYQKDSIPVSEIAQKLTTDKDEIDRLITRKKEIDTQIAQLPTNYVASRQKLMASFDPEEKKINDRIDELQKEISDYQTKKINTEAHIGPIMYVAKTLGQDPDKAIIYFTLLIISVFDPVAVALTVMTNKAIKDYKAEKELKAQKPALEAKELIVEAPIEPESDITPAIPTTEAEEPKPSGLTEERVIEIISNHLKPDEDTLKKSNEILTELRK